MTLFQRTFMRSTRVCTLLVASFLLMGAEDDCLSAPETDMGPTTTSNNAQTAALLNDFKPYTLRDNRTFKSQQESEVGAFGVKLCGRFIANGDDASSRTLTLEDPQAVGSTDLVAGCNGSGSDTFHILRYFRDVNSWSGRPGADTCARGIDSPSRSFSCGQYSTSWQDGRHKLLLKIDAENDSGAAPAYLRVDVIDKGDGIEYQVVCAPIDFGDGTWDVTCDGTSDTPVVE